MNDRDRLIELIADIQNDFEKWCVECAEDGHKDHQPLGEYLADKLLQNGVIIPPCKVGDTVYVRWALNKACKYGIYPVKVYALRWDTKKNNFRVCVEGNFQISAYGGRYTHYYRAAFTWDNVGKTVFLTKEEAEQALKEREQNG